MYQTSHGKPPLLIAEALSFRVALPPLTIPNAAAPSASSDGVECPLEWAQKPEMVCTLNRLRVNATAPVDIIQVSVVKRVNFHFRVFCTRLFLNGLGGFRPIIATEYCAPCQTPSFLEQVLVSQTKS